MALSMGGWVTEIGAVTDFDERLSRFKKTFSVEGVPPLGIETKKHKHNARTIAWAWNLFGIPDIHIKQNKDGTFIILCGVITHLGHFGILPDNKESLVSHVLKLWIENGDNLIKELNGSFSCLFHEPNNNQTTLYTDRFASRPIWFTYENNTWFFGNFPSAIIAMKKNSPKIDPVGLWSLFHTGRHLGKHGLYSKMNCLLAGEKAILTTETKIALSKWIERKYVPDNSIKARQWGENIATTLQKSSRRYKNVCESPYIFLSGGLDSRIAAAAFGKPMKSISLGNSPNAETRTASLVSKIIGIEHQTVYRSPYWYLNTMNAAALISAGNFLTCHIHFIVPASEIASKIPGVEFFLGDLIENFNKHYFSIPKKYAVRYEPQNMIEIMHSYIPYSNKDKNRLGIFFRNDIRKNIKIRYIEALEEYAKSIINVSQDDSDRLDTLLRWSDVSVTPTFNMITCLRTVARERNIFFDNEVNQINLQIPSSIRDKRILHKWILFHLNKKLPLIPDANNFLPPIFPNSFSTLTKKIRPYLGKIRRKKLIKSNNTPSINTSGSWLIMHEMYRKDPLYKEYIEKVINDKECFPEEIFDAPQIKQTWEKYLAGNIYLHNEIDALLSFGALNKLLPSNGIDFFNF